jgi:hypothetical protein
MTEQTPPPGPYETDQPDRMDETDQSRDAHPDESSSAADGPTSTGVPSVDAVLAEIDDLDGRPLEEHLATFERAHQALRSALDEGGPEPALDEPSGGGAGPAADEPA